MRMRAKFIVGTVSLALTAAVLSAAPAPAKEKVPPEASAAVRRMSDFLGKTKDMAFVADSSLEVVRSSGEKLQFNARSRITLARPNKLRSERVGSLADLIFVYDGSNYTLYGKRANMYATTEAPHTLDQAIDDVRDRLDIDAPAADLLFTNSYAGLMDGVRSGQDLGPDIIDGVSCRHLAFQKEDVDFQLWIREESDPLPCKYLITSKHEKGDPQFEVTLSDWRLGQPAPEGAFKFVPPDNAERIDFMLPAAPRRNVSGS